jgi:hypothetical protein
MFAISAGAHVHEVAHARAPFEDDRADALLGHQSLRLRDARAPFVVRDRRRGIRERLERLNRRGNGIPSAAASTALRNDRIVGERGCAGGRG